MRPHESRLAKDSKVGRIAPNIGNGRDSTTGDVSIDHCCGNVTVCYGSSRIRYESLVPADSEEVVREDIATRRKFLAEGEVVAGTHGARFRRSDEAVIPVRLCGLEVVRACQDDIVGC